MVTMKKQYIIIKTLALLLLAGGCTIDLEDLNPENFKHQNTIFFELQENLYDYPTQIEYASRVLYP